MNLKIRTWVLDYISNETASVIVRTFDNNYKRLVRTLKSINDNDYRHKEAVIVYQGIDNEYFEKIQKLKSEFDNLKFVFVQNPTNQDERAKNANIGIKNATGRYIGFLDDDDIFYAKHISTLVNLLKKSSFAWAYAQSDRCLEENGKLVFKDKPYFNESFNFKNFWQEDYIPMISFIIDLSKIKNRSVLSFNESFTQGEDYLFLLKLSLHYEPVCCTEFTNAFLYKKENSIHIAKRKENGKRLRKEKQNLSKDIYWFNETIFERYNYQKRLFKFAVKILKKFRLSFIVEKI